MSKYLGVFLGLATLLFLSLSSIFPSWVDVLYYRLVFQGLRVLYDYSLGLLPMPMVYVLFVVLVYVLAGQLRSLFRLWDASAILLSVRKMLLQFSSLVGYLVFAFYFSWGINYKRTPLDTEMGIDFHASIEETQIIEEARLLTDLLLDSRSQINADTAIRYDDLPLQMEGEIRQSLSKVLRELSFPTFGRPRVRILHPRGILLRISTAGVYIPFVAEGHIDAGLHPIQYPYTMAHEMTHAYGFTDEGVCNFIALLACVESDHPIYQYSALRVYWRYLMNQLYQIDKDEFQRLQALLTPEIKADFQAIRTCMDLYPDIMPKVRDKIYDTYLKSNGIKSGLKSYSQMVRMMMAWKASEHNPSVRKALYGK